MNISKINKIEAIALILIVMVNYISLNLPETIIKSTSTSAILNTVYVFIVMLVFTFIIVKLFKNFNNSDIIDISEYLGGKVLKVIIAVLFILYFIITSSNLITTISKNIKIVYFHDLSINLIIFIFLLTVAITHRFKLYTTVKSNVLILPIVLAIIILICIFGTGDFNTNRVYPILGYGINETFFTGLSNIFAYSGLAYIFLIMPMLKDTKEFGKVAMMSVIVSGLLLILSVASLSLSFPFVEDFSGISSLYNQSRYIHDGRLLQRIDGIFVLGWMLAAISYISVSVLFLETMFKKIAHIKGGYPVSLVFLAVIYILASIPKGTTQARFFEGDFVKYSTLILVFGIGSLLLIFANIKHSIKSRKGGVLKSE